jgi:NADH-quinone oxidoreductase subunit E
MTDAVPELHEVDVPDELRLAIEGAMSRYPQVRSAALPALWAVQRQYGWCSPEGIRQAAAVMGVTPGYLESLATFYDLFRTTPVGRHQVLVCHNISCWMRGGDDLLQAFCEAAGADVHEADHGGASSPDGEVYVSGFECLGACDLAPMASIDERYYGPLEAGDAQTAIEQLRSGAEVLPDKNLAERPAAGGPEPGTAPETRMLFRGVDEPGLASIDTYRRLGGYSSLERAFRDLEPEELLGVLEESGLRGRGGAGFSMGKKASFLPRGEMSK